MCKWCVLEKESAVLMLDTKRAILGRLQKGAKPSSLMKEFSCGKATQSLTSRTRRELYIAFISTLETLSGTKRHKMHKREAHENLENVTYLWFLQEHSRGTPISGPILTENALQFHCRLHGKESVGDFKASQE